MKPTTEAAPAAAESAPTSTQDPAAAAPAPADTAAPAATATPQATSLLAQDPDATGDAATTAPTIPDGPPETYEFSHPEGQELKPEMLEKFTDLAKGLKLSNTDAQKALDWYRENVLPTINRDLETARAAVIDGWVNEVKNDPEMGGPKLDQTRKTILRLIAASPNAAEFRQMLDDTGMANNPVMWRFLHFFGMGMQEDRDLIQGKPTTDNLSTLPAVERLKAARRT